MSIFLHLPAQPDPDAVTRAFMREQFEHLVEVPQKMDAEDFAYDLWKGGHSLRWHPLGNGNLLVGFDDLKLATDYVLRFSA